MDTLLAIFIMTDQPTTCPYCGSRSEILSDYCHTNSKSLLSVCNVCDYLFVEQEDEV